MDRADPPRISPIEWAVVAVMTTVALCLRAWDLPLAGLTQFDEGVYAFTALGLTDATEPLRMFPGQQKFSPPVYFSLAALMTWWRGASDQSLILVNVILGTATIPVWWGIARRWFGPAVAAGSATLLALNETHVLLSRAALTDVAFTLVFVIALAALVRMLHEPTTWHAIMAGLATGLAWNTKYHGWFAGLIAIGAVVGLRWRWGDDALLRERRRALIVAAVIAGLCYLPWLLYIRSQPGDLTGWSRYFATMLRLNWPGNFVTHVQQQHFLEGAFSRTAWAAAAAVSLIVTPHRPRGHRAMLWMVGVAVAGLVLGAFAVAGVLMLLGLVALLRTDRPAHWVLAAWLVLWILAAPVYHPYFRLLLPMLPALFAGAMLVVTRAWEAAPGRREDRGLVPLALGLILMTVPLAAWWPDPSNPWRRTDAFRLAAERLARQVPAGERVVVLGEPELAWYLHRAGRPSFSDPKPVDVDSLTPGTWLVTGVYTQRAPRLREAVQRRLPELQRMERVHVEAGDLRLLDDSPVARARAYRTAPDSTFDLTLYRLPGGTR